MVLANRHFKNFIWISAAGHLFLFISFWLFSTFSFPSKSVRIQEAIRVDMVGLPDLVQKPSPKKAQPKKPKPAPKKPPQKKPKPAPKKTPPKKQPPKKDLNQTKQSQTEAIKNLKATTTAEKPTYKGEQISKGDSETGQLDTVLMYAYFTRVRSHIKLSWNLPRFLADKDYKATVVIEVNSEGNIMRIKLEKSSGNESFDQAVIRAISMASPLPRPPKELRGILREGVGFNFPD